MDKSNVYGRNSYKMFGLDHSKFIKDLAGSQDEIDEITEEEAFRLDSQSSNAKFRLESHNTNNSGDRTNSSNSNMKSLQQS